MQISNSDSELIRNMSAEVLGMWKKVGNKALEQKKPETRHPSVTADHPGRSAGFQHDSAVWTVLVNQPESLWLRISLYLFIYGKNERGSCPVSMPLSKWFFSFFSCMPELEKLQRKFRADAQTLHQWLNIRHRWLLSEIKVRTISNDTFIFPTEVIFITSFQRPHASHIFASF